MMKTSALAFSLWMLILCSPALAGSEFYQWTDSQGTIHLTDNLSLVPEEIRASSGMLIRRDFDTVAKPLDTPAQPQQASEEPPAAAKPPDQPRAIESDLKTAPINIQYTAQVTNIVVVNSVIRPIRKHFCPKPEGCQGVFRPNFADRQYIHPSVFNGGSRQYVQPELFPPVRK